MPKRHQHDPATVSDAANNCAEWFLNEIIMRGYEAEIVCQTDTEIIIGALAPDGTPLSITVGRTP